MKLKGVCLHQDHAGVGVAIPDALIAWRLERLKAMGCNAIRCSHNAPAAEFLDLCDRMGFLVMDENRLFNPAPETMAQLEWMVRRDRNHPSVILWSVFNEEPMQGSEAGVEMVRRMAHAVHVLDEQREPKPHDHEGYSLGKFEGAYGGLLLLLILSRSGGEHEPRGLGREASGGEARRLSVEGEVPCRRGGV